MLFSAWRRWLRAYSRLVRGRAPRRLARTRRTPVLEPLEDRFVPSTSIPLSPLSWTSIGPQPVINANNGSRLPGAVSGRVDSFAASPTDPNTFYVGAAGGGVWKTTDGGKTYTPLTDHVTDSQGNPIPEFMGSLALDPTNANIIYAGTGDQNGLPGGGFQFDANNTQYGMGILKSSDGGQTWQVLNPNGIFTRRAIAKIVVDPSNDLNVYAAVVANGNPPAVNSDGDQVVNGLSGNTGIWKSTNGGATWTNTTASIDSADPWTDLVMDPQNPQVLFAAVGNDFGSAKNGVYESTDGGGHWSLVKNVPQATSGGRIALAISHPATASKATIYAVVVDPAFQGLLAFDVSGDGGKTWTQKKNTPNFLGGQGFYDIAIAADPNNPQTVFAAGQITYNEPFAPNSDGVIESNDGGNNWIDLTNGTSTSIVGPHTDTHALVFDAAGGVLNGNDGGVWRFANNAWTDLNFGLDTLQFEGVALNPANPNIAYGGAQDNGTNEFDDSLGWKQLVTGDGGFVHVDPSNINGPGNPPTIYQEFPRGFIQRSDNGGSSFTDITPPNANGSSPNFYVTYALDPSTPGRILYGGAGTLQESLDYGFVDNTTSPPVSSWVQTGTFPAAIDAIAVAPSDPQTVYVSSDGMVYVTTNDPNGLSGGGTGGGGSATFTSSNLPGLPAGTVTIKDLAVDPTDPTIVYAVVQNFTGGAGTVFEGQTVNGTTTWTNISALAGDPSADLPDIPADSIVIDPNAGDPTARTIYVGTDAGVYFTQDSGGHWHRYGVNMPNAQVLSLDLLPNLGGPGGILLAGTHGRGAWEVIPQAYEGGITLSPQEGLDPGPQVVAHFIDSAGQPAGTNYAASIDWGDGTGSTPGSITYNAATGLFDVYGDHAYAEEGKDTITVTFQKGGATAASVTSIASVTDPAVAMTAGTALTATEGADSGSLALATFTDPGGPEAVGDYTAAINWGDGTASNPDVTTGVITFNKVGGVFTVSGDHVYAEEGSYPVTVTVSHDKAPAASVTASLTVADTPVIASGGLTVAAGEGLVFHNAPVATFTDPGGAEAVGNYTATIDWGDGTTPDNGLIVFSGTPGSQTDQFTVEGTHKYAEDGDYTITAVLSNDGNAPQTVTSSASVADQQVLARGLTFNSPEGNGAAGAVVAQFTDPGGAEPTGDYAATIDWGDGSSATPGTISYNAVTGVFSVLGNHAYGEEGSSFQVTVRITHDALPAVTVNSVARVTDAPVSLTGGLTLTPAESASFGPQAVATFTDPGGAEPLSDYSASIDWGDGQTSAGAISYDSTANAFTVAGSHAYTEEGTYTITTTVHHDTAPAASITSTATVADPPVSATGGYVVTVTEGAASSAEVVAIFTDPAGPSALSDYSATISWGDGTSSAGTIAGPDGNGVFSVLGGHSYTEEGSTYPLSVTISHETTSAQVVAGTADVVDGPVDVTGGLTYTGTESVPAGTPQVVATFTDPGGAEAPADYGAMIDWGDGTAATPGTISGPDGNGVFKVSGSHTYTQESPAGSPYQVTVSVSHDVAPVATGTSSAVISDPAVQVTGGAAVTATEGADSGPEVVATFTDPAGSESVADYSATVAWGDGQTSAGTIAYDPTANDFTVTADHTYAENGAFTPHVTVHHGTAPDVSVTDAAVVSDPPVVGQGGFTFSGVRGFTSSTQVVATFTDPGGAEAVGDYAASIDWGDGTSPTPGTISYAGAPGDPNGVFSVQGSHKYTTSGDHPLKVTIRHENAVTVTVPDSTAISELPVVASGGQVLNAIESVPSDLQAVATFTDPAGAEDLSNYSATINWNDGTTSSGVITYNGSPGSKTGVFTVLGSHAYTDPVSPPITVTIHHSFAPDVTVQSSSSVTPVLNLVEVLSGPLHRTRHHGFVQMVQILNLTGNPLAGRFVIVLDGLGLTFHHGKLRHNGVRLLNATGFTPGPLGALSPYVVGAFGPGVLGSPQGGVFLLEFSAPPKTTPQYTPRLLEGSNVP